MSESPPNDPAGEQPPTSSPSGDPSERPPVHNGVLAGAGGGIMAVVAAPLPWATVSVLGFSASASGTDGDGMLTLLLGIAAIVLAGLQHARGPQNRLAIGLIAVGAATTVIGVTNVADVNSALGEIPDVGLGLSASAGIGLILTVIAGLGETAGGIALRRASSG